MPWRQTPRIIHTDREAWTITERSWALLRILAFWLIVLSVVVLVGTRNSWRNADAARESQRAAVAARRASDRARIASDRAQRAARKTSEDLTAALALVDSPEARAAGQAVRDRVARMEWALCKGPCPPVPAIPTTTTPP